MDCHSWRVIWHQSKSITATGPWSNESRASAGPRSIINDKNPSQNFWGFDSLGHITQCCNEAPLLMLLKGCNLGACIKSWLLTPKAMLLVQLWATDSTALNPKQQFLPWLMRCLIQHCSAHLQIGTTSCRAAHGTMDINIRNNARWGQRGYSKDTFGWFWRWSSDTVK